MEKGWCKANSWKNSRFKMFWSGNEGTGRVGVFLAEELWERVFEVVRVSDRIILVQLTIGKIIIWKAQGVPQ